MSLFIFFRRRDALVNARVKLILLNKTIGNQYQKGHSERMSYASSQTTNDDSMLRNSQKECTSRESNAGPIDVGELNLVATMDFTTKPLVLMVLSIT